jgi:DNA polymerase III sliding clamp (beta) subunit (PCNA family)
MKYEIDLARWLRIEQIGAVASKDGARVILTGVLVEPGDGVLLLTATDSYRLAHTSIEAESVPGDGFLLPAKAVRDIRVAVGKVPDLGKNPDITLDIEDGHATFTASNGLSEPLFIQRLQLIDGKFPNYRALLPKKKGPVSASFDPALVSSMATAAAGSDHRYVDFRVGDPLKPAVLTSPADPNWVGMIMPVRP